ncbi:hypothetical protein [Sphingopyxis sp. BSNA05]|uniref:hypothetical protein n=1 Tax=Sphingopyxis sp. BSNA05 TaxID=1236614 RepID=UPI001C25D634|nr:hypothetical protein [Sphingopyxis sp. BSNA05]
MWEATRPAFRVRYIHDLNGQPLIPLYASYGSASGKTARAKLARIVRRAPEVLVKVTGRQKGGRHVKAHLEYIGRKGDVEIESRDGEILTSKEDIAERAAEWSDTLQWRSRPTVSSVSLVFRCLRAPTPTRCWDRCARWLMPNLATITTMSWRFTPIRRARMFI